jgi:signal transduction histidine kinase
MKIDFSGFSYTFSNLELALISILIVFFFYYVFILITKKKEIRYLTSNFLDELGFENDPKVLASSIITKVMKNYKFTAYSVMFINSTEVDLGVYLSEKVPDLFIEDIKRKTFESLVESGVPGNIENKKVNLSTQGESLDNKIRKVLTDCFIVPIIVNDVLIGAFCFASSDYLKEDKLSILDIYEGVNRRFSDLSKFLESVQEDKDKFEDLINSMNNPVAMLGKNFDLIYINPAFEVLLKLSSPKDFNILDFSKNMPKNLDLEETLQEVLLKSEMRVFKNINYKGFIYDVSFFPVIKLSKVDAVSILFQEVTSEYQNEKIKQEFTAMLIHELRAPLTVIKSSSDLLIKRYNDLTEAKFKDILSGVRSSTEGLLDLVSDLLDTSKLEMNKLQILRRVSNLNTFVQEKASFFVNEMQAKKLKLVISLDNKIEEYAFDDNKFTQVLNNLLSNALKYTDKGSITVSTKKSKEGILIDVADTGVGVPDDQKSKLFNKYMQLESSIKNKSKGTGLGLVVAKGIIEAHGGKIVVLDNKPHGTIFRIILPVE